ncbi:efflux RND transporter periplasmic adaptor subunit [Microbacterium dextranolyticum]|uniref:Uncharacterized protein n=1 Tax=Microbacterium dextranolyticum TaxID=36806 RepID=A0A9W6M721_9MICO|nr:biotin/lipoyl-binding protein [Microbacterium dextranolyticum]MBM7463718.1 multidrug efflux pump subunit AcrA (membrane-fusion protein) [Microbacterium dextranolyticum]GLJ96451.1 hypothetical protein GCM10017591_25140 [Microbacterium dextranolyticum]
MVVWRRWIFPLLMLVVCAVIAAALVKLAFFPDRTDAAAITPGGAVTSPVIPVQRANLTSELTVNGTVARDDAVTVRATVEGTVTDVAVGAGQSVQAGQTLVTVTQVETNRRIDITAPEAGDVSSFELVPGQSVSLGAEVAKLTPARFHVTGKVDPVLLYRLVGAPTDAQTTIQGGPAPFTCTGLRVQVAEDGTTSVVCAVPADQQVFAGLTARLDVRVGSAEGVLVVPTTAVKGGAGTGTVWLDTDGAAEERAVKLGLSDGTSVEVVEGLSEGDTVRQFVPGVSTGTEPICHDDGAGGTFCEAPGMSW